MSSKLLDSPSEGQSTDCKPRDREWYRAMLEEIASQSGTWLVDPAALGAIRGLLYSFDSPEEKLAEIQLITEVAAAVIKNESFSVGVVCVGDCAGITKTRP